MFKNRFRSEKGFGLIQAIAGLLIASVSLLGLFIASHYVKTKAVENLHYRKALLKANDELEQIKWKYPQYGVSPSDISYYYYDFILDEKNDLEARVFVNKKTENDLSISVDTRYATIVVKVEWEEIYDIFMNNQDVKRSIALQEDYYYRISR